MNRRVWWFAALIAASSAAAPLPVYAGAREDVIDTLLKCADMPELAARDSCFEATIPQLRAAAQTAPMAAPAAPAGSETAAAAPPPQQGSILDSLNPFGGTDNPQPSPQQMAYQPIGTEILPITIGVAEFEIGPGGGFQVTLDNGQVWQERPEHSDIPPFHSDRKNMVMIEKGMLGGYNLYWLTGGTGKIYKVMRVK
jgi:hypothetical protein